MRTIVSLETDQQRMITRHHDLESNINRCIIKITNRLYRLYTECIISVKNIISRTLSEYVNRSTKSRSRIGRLHN